ncbi:MAG: peptidyl-prolyl cis-trans isomerase [Chlorobi bacterium]|nr:peptidyl-prolyl cis-trans isomerase [Chlorobiota bacterium]
MQQKIRTLVMTMVGIAGIAVVLGCSSGNGVIRKEGEPPVTHSAVIKTSMGDIEVELYGEDAPKTVANFVGLADKKFYDGILFHRVVPGFVIQAGDPKTKNEALKGEWGTGGESIYNGRFADELNPATVSYKRGYAEGVLAMANAGPNTNTSQFFIMLADNTTLPKNYTIFGRVTKGLDIVHKIEGVDLGENSQPKVPVKILSVKTHKY